jgi:hypothetical protein
MTLDRSGQEPQAEGAVGGAAEHLSQQWRGVIVADNQPVTGVRIQRQASMAQVGMDHAGFVLGVIVDP